MVGRDTPKPIRSGRPCKTSQVEGCGQRTENPPALAVGSVKLNDSYDSETIISLERSSNGGPFKHYTTLATKSSSRTSYSVSTSKSNLSSSYDYRVKAEVYVYDENGRQIDYDYQYLN